MSYDVMSCLVLCTVCVLDVFCVVLCVSHCLHMLMHVYVLVGKQSSIMLSPEAVSCNGDCAVTIVTKNCEINLVAESTEMLTAWLVSDT